MKTKKTLSAVCICCIMSAFQTPAVSQVAGEIAKWEDNKKAAVSIQFDGWYETHSNVAIPELIKRRMAATFFVTPGVEWMPIDWDKAILASENGIEIANHSWTHNCDFNDPDLDLALEIDSAKVFIERMTGKRVYTYAYQCGNLGYPFTERELLYMQRIETAGHVAARGVNWQYPQGPIESLSYDFEKEFGKGYYLTRAFCIMNANDPRQSVPIYTDWIRNTIAGEGLLQYFHHDLAYTLPTSSGYAVSVERFNEYLDILESFRNQVWIATYGDAIRYHREAKSASLQEVQAPNGQSWTVKLTHTLPDKELFDYPLTLMLKMNGVNYNKITQNGKELNFTVSNDTIMFKAVPNGANILLEATPTGITAPIVRPVKIIGYYSIMGQRLPQEPQRGLYIIKYDNGKAKKIIK